MEDLFIKMHIASEQAMLALSAKLASVCGDAAVMFLHGPLGAGKTTFCRGFLHGLGYTQRVKSPTYTLVEPYQLAHCTVYHFDLYRIKNPQELEFMGIEDYFATKAICLIEWAEQGGTVLPMPDLSCYIEMATNVDINGRDIKLIPHTAQGETILRRFEYG